MNQTIKDGGRKIGEEGEISCSSRRASLWRRILSFGGALTALPSRERIEALQGSTQDLWVEMGARHPEEMFLIFGF